MNNSGSWKLLGTFDAAEEDYADDILTCAGNLADALNAANPGRGKGVTLRVATNEALPDVLMRYEGREHGWRDARTGEPA
jgi:hypothetical protein